MLAFIDLQTILEIAEQLIHYVTFIKLSFLYILYSFDNKWQISIMNKLLQSAWWHGLLKAEMPD